MGMGVHERDLKICESDCSLLVRFGDRRATSVWIPYGSPGKEKFACVHALTDSALVHSPTHSIHALTHSINQFVCGVCRSFAPVRLGEYKQVFQDFISIFYSKR